MTLHPVIEELIANSLLQTEQGVQLVMDPNTAHRLIGEIARTVETHPEIAGQLGASEVEYQINPFLKALDLIQRQALIEKIVKRLNRQSFIERIELFDPIGYGLSRIDVQITLIVNDAKKLFPTPFEYDYKFSSNARVYGKTHKVKGLNFTGMTFKGDGFLLRIYNKTQELENEPDTVKKEVMANRLSPFSKCQVWRIEIQLEGNLNRYKENFNLDEDELTLKIFKDFNKRKKIDFLNKIIEATEARLPEKPRPHGWLFEQPITFPPLL